MATNKISLAYYSLDTDRYQNRKIKRLKKNFGCAGLAVHDYLLCEIYRVKGCFLVWDEDCAFDVAEYFGIKESLVKEIVNYCGVVGLFEKELLTGESIITSLAIQERYTDICIRAKRKQVIIPEQYRIIPEQSEITVEVCDVVKYSKVKKSKEEIPPIPLERGSESDFSKKNDSMERDIPINFQVIIDMFNKRCPSLPKISSLTSSRKDKITARVHEMKKPEKMWEVFDKAEKSKFLTGKAGGFRASFDWIFENEDNWVKISEGNYDNNKTISKTSSSSAPTHGSPEWIRNSKIIAERQRQESERLDAIIAEKRKKEMEASRRLL